MQAGIRRPHLPSQIQTLFADALQDGTRDGFVYVGPAASRVPGLCMVPRFLASPVPVVLLTRVLFARSAEASQSWPVQVECKCHSGQPGLNSSPCVPFGFEYSLVSAEQSGARHTIRA